MSPRAAAWAVSWMVTRRGRISGPVGMIVGQSLLAQFAIVMIPEVRDEFLDTFEAAIRLRAARLQ